MIKTTIFILAILSVSNCTLGIISPVFDSTTANAFACMAKGGYPDANI